MELAEVSMINRANAISVENRTSVIVRVLNGSDYHETDLSVRIKQINDPDILLHDASPSQVTSLHVSRSMYGFDYPRGTLSLSFHPEVSADDVTTSSIVGMTVGHHVLNNEAKVLLLDGRHFLKAVR